ncbi:MAG TPA: nucleotidyltransferase domain-containing protein [Candidatus Nanoarchaeia archaeon]|nr:nucleotidyltransferase domain-containing protein [Candidatus Nanoarchaeia archaeon]
MGKPSKEQEVLRLFLNYPSKPWRFKEINERVALPENKTSAWLKKFIDQDLIKKVKETGKLPYYLADYQSPAYTNTKKLFALNQFHQSGLLNYLSSIKEAKAIILFGSFCRGDWHQQSDIDLFIYGKIKKLNLYPFQNKLHREVQIFICKDKKELKKFGSDLLKSIIKGITLKGELPIEVLKYASV